LRTTARCSSEYEWGVHAVAFGAKAGFSEALVDATKTATGDDPVWTTEQARIIRFVDELHDTQTLSDGLWSSLREVYSDEQVIEMVYLVGQYHAVSFFTNAFRLAPEPFGRRFDSSK